MDFYFPIFIDLQLASEPVSAAAWLLAPLPRHVIIMGPFASQVAVTSLRGHSSLLTAGWNIAITARTVFIVDVGSYPSPKTHHIFGLLSKT